MIKKQPKQKKKLDPMVIRRWLIISAIVLVAALTAFNIWLARTVKVEKAIAQKQEEKLASKETITGEAAIGGDFSGIDHNGTPFTFSNTTGKLRLVFFGFTHCPDICPVSLATLSGVQDELGDQSQQVVPIFVTVDPNRDTPEVIKSYISSFHSSMIGVTGDTNQIKQATEAFKVYHATAKTNESGEYNVDHSGFIYLISRDGKYLAHFPYDATAQKVISTLTPYL